jgi:hypothetical protein
MPLMHTIGATALLRSRLMIRPSAEPQAVSWAAPRGNEALNAENSRTQQRRESNTGD